MALRKAVPKRIVKASSKPKGRVHIINSAEKTAAQIEELTTMAEQYVELRRQRDFSAAEMSKLTPRMMAMMEELDIDETENARVKVKKIEPTSTVTDQQKLEVRLGARMWNRITTRVLDKNKLDAYVKSGEIDPKVVVACQSTTDGTAYVKVSTK
ncbi:MAG: hypothetical protein WBO55_10335 [Rhizobiaceae bacterium]